MTFRLNLLGVVVALEVVLHHVDDLCNVPYKERKATHVLKRLPTSRLSVIHSSGMMILGI